MRPATSTTDDYIEQVRALILNNPRVTNDYETNNMHISHVVLYKKLLKTAAEDAVYTWFAT